MYRCQRAERERHTHIETDHRLDHYLLVSQYNLSHYRTKIEYSYTVYIEKQTDQWTDTNILIQKIVFQWIGVNLISTKSIQNIDGNKNW